MLWAYAATMTSAEMKCVTTKHVVKKAVELGSVEMEIVEICSVHTVVVTQKNLSRKVLIKSRDMQCIPVCFQGVGVLSSPTRVDICQQSSCSEAGSL